MNSLYLYLMRVFLKLPFPGFRDFWYYSNCSKNADRLAIQLTRELFPIENPHLRYYRELFGMGENGRGELAIRQRISQKLYTTLPSHGFSSAQIAVVASLVFDGCHMAGRGGKDHIIDVVAGSLLSSSEYNPDDLEQAYEQLVTGGFVIKRKGELRLGRKIDPFVSV